MLEPPVGSYEACGWLMDDGEISRPRDAAVDSASADDATECFVCDRVRRRIKTERRQLGAQQIAFVVCDTRHPPGLGRSLTSPHHTAPSSVFTTDESTSACSLKAAVHRSAAYGDTPLPGENLVKCVPSRPPLPVT